MDRKTRDPLTPWLRALALGSAAQPPTLRHPAHIYLALTLPLFIRFSLFVSVISYFSSLDIILSLIASRNPILLTFLSRCRRPFL